jgi:hypothetical protein
VHYINEKDAVSCGYTSLLATGRDRFMSIYSDFKTTLWMVALSVAALAGMIECKAENIAASASTKNIAPASEGAVAVADSVLKHSLLRPSPLGQIAKSETTNGIEFRSPWLRAAFSKNAPQITALCWDSLGEGKLSENLLKTGPGGGARLRPGSLFEETTAPALDVPRQGPPVQVDGNVVRYLQGLPGGGLARWEIRVEPKTMKIALASITGGQVARASLQLQFAFDISKTSVAPLANPKPGTSASLPCLLHAADYGTLALSSASGPALCLTGQPLRRLAQWNASVGPIGTTRASDGLMSLPSGATEWAIECTVTPQTVPLPHLGEREASLKSLPRSWLNTFQYRPDIGILANNIVSDNAVFCMFTFTDPAVFTPPLPGGVEAIQLARESLDRYFNGATGYGIGWEDIETDTYPSLLISAWDVVRVTGDLKLLRHWLPALENIAAKAIAQDHDGNGLPESSRTGLRGTTKCPTGNWWDQINFGHEDAYVCAPSYRAFQCLADLERLAQKPEQAARYDERARKFRRPMSPIP